MLDELIESMEQLRLEGALTKRSATKARKALDLPHQCITCKVAFKTIKELRGHLRTFPSCMVSCRALLRTRECFVRRRLQLDENEPIDWAKVNDCSRGYTLSEGEMDNLASIARLEHFR
eukprot:c2178_g1_i1.p1 GENE.c2178_g1_i1~~c2178_g1_i1.p1  ORF type:complete len:119 (+),score=13.64 c2178_g1_i1:111-467(+)